MDWWAIKCPFVVFDMYGSLTQSQQVEDDQIAIGLSRNMKPRRKPNGVKVCLFLLLDLLIAQT